MPASTSPRALPRQDILLTGSTGFVGSHVAMELSRRKRTIVPLLRQDPAKARGAGWEFQACVRGDLSTEANLRAGCEMTDVVIHVAGLTKATRDREYFDVNVEGTRRLARAAASANPR